MREWTEERLSLLALGYSRVLFRDVICLKHGVWRLGIAEVQENYCCPRCNAACEARFLCEGCTCRPLPLAPAFVEFPGLRQELRALVMMTDAEERITRKRRAGKLKHSFDRHRRKYGQGLAEQREPPLWR